MTLVVSGVPTAAVFSVGVGDEGLMNEYRKYEIDWKNKFMMLK